MAAVKYANLARMRSSTSGTGTVTLLDAVSGFLTFALAGVQDGATVSYAISDGAQSEVGRGVYTSATQTLTRSVLKSTNGDAAISLSGNPDQVIVAITALAEDFPWERDGSLSTHSGEARVGSLSIPGSSSGLATIVAPAAAGTPTLTLPTTSGTLATTSDKLSAFAATSSAELAGVISDETGTGLLVFGTSPSFTTDIRPASNDGASIGISGTAFSDLFLAAGGVINWNAGNVTLTHSAGKLTLNNSTAGAFAPELILTNTNQSSDASLKIYHNTDDGWRIRVGGSSSNLLLFDYTTDDSSFSTKITVNASGDTTLASTTASTSTSTGALVVGNGSAGGLGVGGAIYGGGVISAASASGFYLSSILFARINTGIVQIFSSDGATPVLQSDSGATNSYLDGTTIHLRSPGGASTYAQLSSVGFRALAPTGGIGYGTGAGGAVTQGTSRTTGVTLNTVCGQVTLFSAAGSATPASFTVTNSAVATTDTIILNQDSGTDKYILLVTAVGAGSFEITFYTTGGTTTEQPVINFSVIKAVAA